MSRNVFSRGTSPASGTGLAIIIAAAGFASTIGGLPFNSLPILLGALAENFALSPQRTGLLGSACFAGYLAGTLIAALIIDRLNWRWLTLACGGGTAGALLLSALLSGEGQYLIWALIGFFAASMTCLGLRIMGQLPNKERALGLRQGIELSVTAAVLFALPPLVIAPFRYPGAAVALAALILLLTFSALWLPDNRREARETNAEVRRPPSPRLAYVALGLFFLYGSGQIGLWAFLERMGNGLRLSPTELGTVFAVLKLLGGAAALLGAAVGDRLGPRLPHLVAFCITVLGLSLLAGADGFLAFGFGTWTWEVGFTLACLYQIAALARLDPSGRTIVLVPAAFGLSSMVGPAVAGYLVADGFTPLLVIALASALLPPLAYVLAIAARIPSSRS